MSQGFTNQQTYAVLPPTVQKFTSGSGTYTLPSGAKYIVVEMVGGGGGGAGSSSNATGGAGGTGGTSTFGSSLLTCTGGAGGTGVNPSVVGAGGTATLNSPAIGVSFDGQSGGGGEAQGPFAINQSSGPGGNTPFLGGGQSVSSSNTAITGQTAIANTGSGGAGGVYVSASGAFCGAGGGAGGYIKATISSPSSTYSYAVGAGGTAGTAGTSGAAGGAGAAGIIIVTEYYDLIGIPTNLTLPIPVNQGGTGVTNSNWTAGSLTFSPTTQGIVGTTTNNNAAAGYVGELVSSERLIASAISMTQNVVTNITSISLTAGDWNVWGNAWVSSSAGYGIYDCAISTTSATLPDPALYTQSALASATNGTMNFPAPYKRLSLSSTTTVYLVAVWNSGAGTTTGAGAIYARRAR